MKHQEGERGEGWVYLDNKNNSGQSPKTGYRHET